MKPIVSEQSVDLLVGERPVAVVAVERDVPRGFLYDSGARTAIPVTVADVRPGVDGVDGDPTILRVEGTHTTEHIYKNKYFVLGVAATLLDGVRSAPERCDQAGTSSTTVTGIEARRTTPVAMLPTSRSSK